MTALALPLPAVAVSSDERVQQRPSRPAAATADESSVGIEPATDTADAAPDGAPIPAGGAAVLLLMAAGLIGVLVRRHRLARP